MQYIVLDMEWNQAWPGSRAARQFETPFAGEIVQIGAVRVSERQAVLDEFQVLVRPQYIRKMNSKISKLTGIKDAALKENGVTLPEAIEAFRKWIGEDFAFLTWGFDDIRVLRQNLELYHLETAWIERWYNAQLIFNAQRGGEHAQLALMTALEMMGIAPSRPAHDALGDAYHTALICAQLDLQKGVAEYAKAKEKPAKQPPAPPAECLDRRAFDGFADRSAALEAMTGAENVCPRCGKRLLSQQWLGQPGNRYMTRAACDDCGAFLVRVRLQSKEDGTVRAGRSVYPGDCDAAKSYDRLIKLRDKPRRRKRSAV